MFDSPVLVGFFCCILPLAASHTVVYFVARRGLPSVRLAWRDRED